MVRFLLGSGVSINACPPWTLYDGDLDWMDATDIEKRTALQHAVQNGHLETIDMLLTHKASVNEPPARHAGATALQLAAIQGSIGLTKKLIDLGADVNGARAIWYGRKALEGAAERVRLDTVMLLLEEGCNIHGEGREQCIRAVKLARDNDHMEVASMLKERGVWTDEDEQGISSGQIDEEYEDPHDGCCGKLCDDCQSVDENEDKPRCWESGSEVSEDGFNSHDEDYSIQEDHSKQESTHESAVLEEGEDQFYNISSPVQLEVQPNVEGYTGGVLVDNSGTVDPMPSWDDWAFDDDGNFVGSL